MLIGLRSVSATSTLPMSIFNVLMWFCLTCDQRACLADRKRILHAAKIMRFHYWLYREWGVVVSKLPSFELYYFAFIIRIKSYCQSCSKAQRHPLSVHYRLKGFENIQRIALISFSLPQGEGVKIHGVISALNCWLETRGWRLSCWWIISLNQLSVRNPGKRRIRWVPIA